ncbi:reverse transcriptase [Plakobranchus ocellatus]|uniref:Reverse transcriptase n=1 Tax=Plakobranchus ocellatus TaxID=259542 RepID=A0AAV3Z7L0_9GAST|nr:reverse transcriptase [Plakobranchus ocellatus]
MTAEGVCIPEEQDSKGINQFRPISLLNVEGKIFISIMASRLTKYLTENVYINTSVQKGGIPGVSGGLEPRGGLPKEVFGIKDKLSNHYDVYFDGSKL